MSKKPDQHKLSPEAQQVADKIKALTSAIYDIAREAGVDKIAGSPFDGPMTRWPIRTKHYSRTILGSIPGAFDVLATFRSSANRIPLSSVFDNMMSERLVLSSCESPSDVLRQFLIHTAPQYPLDPDFIRVGDSIVDLCEPVSVFVSEFCSRAANLVSFLNVYGIQTDSRTLDDVCVRIDAEGNSLLGKGMTREEVLKLYTSLLWGSD